MNQPVAVHGISSRDSEAFVQVALTYLLLGWLAV